MKKFISLITVAAIALSSAFSISAYAAGADTNTSASIMMDSEDFSVITTFDGTRFKDFRQGTGWDKDHGNKAWIENGQLKLQTKRFDGDVNATSYFGTTFDVADTTNGKVMIDFDMSTTVTYNEGKSGVMESGFVLYATGAKHNYLRSVFGVFDGKIRIYNTDDSNLDSYVEVPDVTVGADVKNYKAIIDITGEKTVLFVDDVYVGEAILPDKHALVDAGVGSFNLAVKNKSKDGTYPGGFGTGLATVDNIKVFSDSNIGIGAFVTDATDSVAIITFSNAIEDYENVSLDGITVKSLDGTEEATVGTAVMKNATTLEVPFATTLANAGGEYLLTLPASLGNGKAIFTRGTSSVFAANEGESWTNDFSAELATPYSIEQPGSTGGGAWLYPQYMYSKVNGGMMEILTMRMDADVSRPLGMKVDVSNTANPNGYMEGIVEVSFDLMDYTLTNSGGNNGALTEGYVAEFDVWAKTKWGNNIPLIGILDNELRIYNATITDYTSTVIDNEVGYYPEMPTNKFTLRYDVSNKNISVFMDGEFIAERTISDTTISGGGAFKEVVLGTLVHYNGTFDAIYDCGIGCQYVALVDNLSIAHGVMTENPAIESIRYSVDGENPVSTLNDVALGTNTVAVKFASAMTEDALAGITVTDGENPVTVKSTSYDANTNTYTMTLDAIDYKKTYTVNVPTSVGIARAYSESFKVYSEFKISNFAVVNGENKVITDNNKSEIAEDETLTAKIKITNTADRQVKPVLIFALYNDNVLTKVDFKQVDTTVGLGVYEETVPLTVENTENLTIKAFVFDSFTSLMPLIANFSK